MFLDHVNSSGKFLKFLSKNIFTLVKKEGQNTAFAVFSKNTVPCEFLLLKLCNFDILYLISFKVWQKLAQFSQKATPVPN